MKSIAIALLSVSMAAASAHADPGLKITRHGAQPATQGPAENFTGSVRVESRFAAEAPARAGGGLVTFEPGARTAWHTHPLGQTLIVTQGIGLVQIWGQAAQEIRPGDIVVIPPGAKHWHGATPANGMAHYAIAEQLDGKTVDWLEHVTQAQYSTQKATESHPKATADGLSARQQAIPPIAAFMSAGDMPRLSSALNQGLDAGLTVSEAKELLVQLYAYVGFPRSLNALGELMKVVEARKQRGIKDAPGREPSRATPTGEALLAVGKANQTRISGGPVQGPVFDFAPVINQFLQAHLFGDIFERDNLDWQSRELATVAALAATPGVEAQLLSHMRASMRVGLTGGQLRHLTQVLADRGQEQAASRAREALTRALAPASGG
jgi:4-carboxymuconolactone decarboxylase